MWRSLKLSSNAALLTAIGNDLDFSRVFSEQVRWFADDPRGYDAAADLLVLISSSGKSPNVVRACRDARDLGVATFALVGFDGGELLGLADDALHVRSSNYGIVEDVHQAVVHMACQRIKEELR